MTSDTPADAAEFTEAVLAGLSSDPKALSPKWLYDEAGSKLFDEITRVPEYDLPARERAVMADALPAVAAAMRGAAVAEFGIGSGDKSIALIEAVWPPLYVPLDISKSALEGAAAQMRGRFGGLAVEPVAADFTKPVALPAAFRSAERRLGFFPGSTIGNFDDADAAAFLRACRETLGADARFLVGVDLVRDVEAMIAAYDDAGGVTARFDLNLLTRINREADGDFDAGRFRHEARWNPERGRIEMHLVSALPQEVTVAGRPFAFAEGESLHTESSHKFTLAGFEGLAERGGWRTEQAWTDEDETFGVFLLAA